MAKRKKSEGALIGEGENTPSLGSKQEIEPMDNKGWAQGLIQRYEFEDEAVDVNAPEVPEEIKALVSSEITPDFPPTFFFEKPGDFIRGVYVSMKENIGPNNSTVHLIEVGKGKDAERVGIWGKTSIDLKMASVPLGSRVFIQLMGLKPGKFSTDWYNFKVLILK